MIYGLDLFSGIGGLTIALQEWVKPIAYCENDRYAQGVLLSRMAEKRLPIAPIWDDVSTLDGKELAHVDIIYGGFPCQDISIAGHGKGLEGERSGLFFEIVRLAKEIKPRFIFLENVPAIRTRGLSIVAKELSDAGYDCRWGVVSAHEMGAPHLRKRWFCLAHSNGSKLREQQRGRCGEEGENTTEPRNNGEKESLADTDKKREQGLPERKEQENSSARKRSKYEIPYNWEIEPDVGRVVNGLPFRVDRIKGLGNAVVPAQAREAFKRLMGS